MTRFTWRRPLTKIFFLLVFTLSLLIFEIAAAGLQLPPMAVLGVSNRIEYKLLPSELGPGEDGSFLG